MNQVSESVLIARRADAALLLLRQGESRRAFAVGARRRLAGMNVPVMGAVLNACSARMGRYGYYYYSHYGYGYGYGYGAYGEGK